MARKLGFDGGMTFIACMLLAGCQTGSNSRVANTATSPSNSPYAKSSIPPPTPATPTNTNNSFRPAAATGASNLSTPPGGALPGTANPQNNFNTATSNLSPAPSNLTPLGSAPTTNNPPAVPSPSLRQPATNNSVVITQPAPELPPIAPPPSSFAPPGISPLPQPQ